MNLYIVLPGILVPRATNEIAVTVSLRPTVQPKWDAKSPTKAVSTPMTKILTRKHAHPFQSSNGLIQDKLKNKFEIT